MARQRLLSTYRHALLLSLWREENREAHGGLGGLRRMCVLLMSMAAWMRMILDVESIPLWASDVSTNDDGKSYLLEPSTTALPTVDKGET